MTYSIRSLLLASGLALGLALPAAHAAAPDWATVQGKDIMLFYPGQAAWEWALTPSNMSGAKDFRAGKKDCGDCHIGEEKNMGPQIVTGTTRQFKTGDKPPIEPTPIANKPGTIPATVKVANDGTNLYVHVDFAPGAQPNSKMDPVDTRLTIMFATAGVPETKRAGCFPACHMDSAGMPSAEPNATRTMYLPKTRAKITANGGGDTLKSPDELAKLRASGYQLEFWQAQLNPGQPAKAVTETVFDKREVLASSPISAQATQSGGNWSVTITRPLNAGVPLATIVPGETYYIGMAIHAGHTAHRFHYVSERRSMVLDDGKADLVAAKH